MSTKDEQEKLLNDVKILLESTDLDDLSILISSIKKVIKTIQYVKLESSDLDAVMQSYLVSAYDQAINELEEEYINVKNSKNDSEYELPLQDEIKDLKKLN